MNIKKMLHTALFALAFSISTTALAEIVVVGPASLTASLSQADVRQIFSGTKSNVNGVTLTPLDLPADSEERKAFYQEVLGKSPAQMRSHWAKMTFTGKGNPPKIVSGIQEMRILFSSSARNYIGYINADEVTDEMRVLFRATN